MAGVTQQYIQILVEPERQRLSCGIEKAMLNKQIFKLILFFKGPL